MRRLLRRAAGLAGLAGLTITVLAITACTPRAPRATVAPDSAPAALLGAFTDDYGSRYRVSPDRFEHLPRSVYRIAEWNVAEQYFIAQNATSNPNDGGLWTRVDWLEFADQGPFRWGYCLTAYRASSREAARATPPADGSAPRSGCNGFPFSRMQPVVDSLR